MSDQGGFGSLLARQVRADVARAPEILRQRLAEGARAQRAVNIAELRTLAARRLPRTVFDYVDGAAGDELTLERNEAELRSLAVVPRVLTGAVEVDLSTTVLGQRVAIPLLGAPTGLTGLVHHEGEVAVARAVHGAGSLYVLSSAGSRSIDEVARLSPGPRWFQLYVGRDRGIVVELLRRARAAGYAALVVTVDVARAGARERDRRNGFRIPPRVTGASLLQGLRHPRWSAEFVTRPRILSQAALLAGVADGPSRPLAEMINSQFDPALNWSDIGWLQEHWDGPIVLKGVLRAADAEQAARLGVAAVAVSNHGGRQLDGAPSSISVLPEIVDAVGGELEVYMDGGIRRGIDIVKALALGARACLSGRALLYGLAAGGAAGAARAMALLVEELSLAMTIAGAASVSELDRSWIAPTQAGRSPRWNTI
jgi:isopentenyl diphosphate isomerase/L-lactate dehydrogenase-like FMN-dependent dehydrogenase